MKNKKMDINKKIQITIIAFTLFILLLCIAGAGIAIYYASQTNSTSLQTINFHIKHLLNNINFLNI